MVSTSAEACADTVISGWVTRFAATAIITLNRGPQFARAVWTVLCHRQLKELPHPRNCDADGASLCSPPLRSLTAHRGRGSLYRWRRPRTADETSLGSDPLPGTTPCQRIFLGASVETGILYVFVIVLIV
jgi:hypothetical protein